MGMSQAMSNGNHSDGGEEKNRCAFNVVESGTGSDQLKMSWFKQRGDQSGDGRRLSDRKTSLMVKYVEGSFDEDYIQTLGVNFMEKTISVRRTTITFSIWDLGGQREFVNMLPLVCNDAVAILFMFDLSRKSTLNSVKEWYRQARGFNKVGVTVCFELISN